MDFDFNKALYESILFIAHEPLSLNFFVKNSDLDKTQAKIVLDSLMDDYLEKDGGVLLVEVAGGYQMTTHPKLAQQLRHVFAGKKRDKLTKSSLEVLAIIAYKQPIHTAAIDELRGASSRAHIGTLMQRGLVRPLQRLELPGRPMAYGTTSDFLKHFGLNSLQDMPKLSEIKEMNFESLSGV